MINVTVSSFDSRPNFVLAFLFSPPMSLIHRFCVTFSLPGNYACRTGVARPTALFGQTCSRGVASQVWDFPLLYCRAMMI